MRRAGPLGASAGAAVLLALLGLLAHPGARAAGLRAPLRAHRLVVSGDGQFLLATNFGLVSGRLRPGSAPRWSCPLAFGLGDDYAPAPALGPGRRLLVGHHGGAFYSDDGGCRFQPALGSLAPHPRFGGVWVDDLEVLAGARAQVLAATSTTARPNGVRASRDGGRSFSPTSLVSPLLYYKSIRATARPLPGGKRRLYATAYGLAPKLRTYLYRSDDGGAHFQLLGYDGQGGGVSSRSRTYPNPERPGRRRLGMVDLRAVAIDADDPDIVYLRLEDHRATRSSLVRGETRTLPGRYHPVLETAGRLSAASLPGGVLLAAGPALGLRRSPDRGRTWQTLRPPPGPPCVAALGKRLLVCGDPLRDRFAVAELGHGGKLRPLVRWRDLRPAGDPKGGVCRHAAPPPGAPRHGPTARHDVRAHQCPELWHRVRGRLAR